MSPRIRDQPSPTPRSRPSSSPRSRFGLRSASTCSQCWCVGTAPCSFDGTVETCLPSECVTEDDCLSGTGGYRCEAAPITPTSSPAATKAPTQAATSAPTSASGAATCSQCWCVGTAPCSFDGTVETCLPSECVTEDDCLSGTGGYRCEAAPITPTSSPAATKAPTQGATSAPTGLPTIAPTGRPMHGFQFGLGCSGGSDSFTETLGLHDHQDIGIIPAGVYDVKVRLKADHDIDIALYDVDETSTFAEGKAVVAWCADPSRCNFGLLGNSKREMNIYKRNGISPMAITYSGYSGTDGDSGDEYIEIKGRSTTQLLVRAFAFKAGTARVDYSWSAPDTDCCQGRARCEHTFQHDVKQGSAMEVGLIPPGVSDLKVELSSDSDADIQLYAIDITNPFPSGQAIVGWCEPPQRSLVPEHSSDEQAAASRARSSTSANLRSRTSDPDPAATSRRSRGSSTSSSSRHSRGSNTSSSRSRGGRARNLLARSGRAAPRTCNNPGLLNGPGAATKEFQGLKFTYSGYEGTSSPGHESLEISGVTNTRLLMKAYGHETGVASVKYSYMYIK